MKHNNIKRKLRGALCLFTVTLKSNHLVYTFTQHETTRRKSTSAALKKNGISKISNTALSEHLSGEQRNILPITEVGSDLGSEFIGLNLASPLGKSNDVRPLFVSQSLSDEQKEFHLMLGKALDT
jgi:isochorismate hydrolase